MRRPLVWTRMSANTCHLRPASLLWSVVLVMLAALSWPRPAGADDELGGASPPRPYTDSRVTRSTDYKRWGQYAVKRLAVGDVEGAEERLRRLREFSPDDDDLTFILAAVVATGGDLEGADELLDEALRYGLPPGRVLTGPPLLSKPLAALPRYRQLEQQLRSEPIHGPMVGAVTDRAASIWVRTAAPAEVVVEAISEQQDDQVNAGEVTVSASGQSTAESDRTVVVRLEGLQPQTAYRYRVSIGGGEPSAEVRFQTFPQQDTSSRFSIAFGGGAGYHPPQERVWKTVRQRRPDALLLLGDNIYSDDPETPAVQRYSYYRRQSRPEFRALVARTPVFSIWDDHDFGTDDSWGGSDPDVPAWKRPVLEVFRQNWVNPSYGGGQDAPGVWYDFSIGQVDFFMLDGRYYRTNAGRFGDEPEETPTMLGPVQNAWLRQRLLASNATFKVIVSPVPWDFRAKPGRAGLDTWRGYAEERAALWDFLSKHRIDGVVLMSADRHRSDAWEIKRQHDYTLYEFNSSRLTNDHQHPTMDEAIFSYNEKQSFGLVRFDTTVDDPEVTYQVISIDDEPVHSLSVRLSQLQAAGR